MRLETRRLLLRPWREEDRVPFAAMNADPEVMRHFPAPLTRAESDALAGAIEADLARGWGLWALEERASGRFVGFTGLAVPRFTARFTPAVEVGWRLARPAWGRGLATEAARAAVAHGFDVLGLDEIVSFTATGNDRSRAVMCRLGMTHDPADDFDHPALPAGHVLRRHVLHLLARPAGRPPDPAPPCAHESAGRSPSRVGTAQAYPDGFHVRSGPAAGSPPKSAREQGSWPASPNSSPTVIRWGGTSDPDTTADPSGSPVEDPSG